MKKLFTFMAVVFTALTLNAEPILVAQAIEACNALDANVTSENEVTVEGFVVNAQDFSWGTNQQIWFMADDKDNTANQEFQAYYCTAEEDGNSVPVLNGDKVQLTGKLTKYVDKENKILLEIKNGKAAFVSKVDGDRSKPEAETITVAKALELGAGVDQGATSKVAYTIVGYVTAYEGKNADTDGGWEQYGNQIFWIADSKDSKAKSNADGAFEIYQGIPTEKVNIGDKVSVYTRIKNYNGILESEGRVPVTILEKGEGGQQEDEETPELPEGVISCAAAVELAASIQDPVEVKTYVEGDVVKLRGYVTYAYDPKEGKQSVWLADKKGSKSGVLQGAYLEITDAVVVGDYVEIEGTLAKYLKEGKDGKPNEVIIEVINGTMRKAIGGKFIISTFVTPENSGQVIVEENKLTAKANDGYHFVQWNDGNTDNPRTVELTKDTTFTAEFAINTSGSCGKDNQLTWTYDTQAKRLTISGNGSFDENMTCGFAKENMEELVIEEGVTSIGSKAFENCTNLTSVSIPNTVTIIEDGAFSKCSNLTSVTLNSNAIVSKEYYFSIGYIFGMQVTEYKIGEDVTGIGKFAFSYCSNLTSIKIPNSITSIESGAFYECTALTSVTIPNSVTSIGSAAFENCSGLTSIEIPNSVTSIGDGAFSKCSNLTSVKLNSNAIVSKDYFYFDDDYWGVLPNIGSIFGTQVTKYIIGEDVTSIGGYAFSGCSRLTSVTIPNSVTSIEGWAFESCSGLTSVTIPNSVTSIGDHAFSGCSGLTSPVYNTHVFAFMPTSCSGAYTIPDGIESIAGYAFYYCSGLTSIEIPNSVTSIGDKAFYNCSALTSIEIPNSVTSIGYSAFCNCSGLTSVTIGNGVTSIGDGAFYNCSALTSIEIPNSVTSIGNNAFYGCHDLASIELPNRIDSIKGATFSGCSSLTSIRIPNSVTSIGKDAFYGCSNLASIEIPNSVTSIETYAFAKCAALKSIEIPNSITLIWHGTFSDCASLTSIEIPNSIKCIGYNPKWDGNGAFEGCTSLKSVVVGNGVTSIEYRAFYGCSNLTELTLGNNLQSIGSEAFASCKRIADINCYAKSVPDIQANTFNDVSRKAYVWVAADQIRKYETDAYWGEFFIKTKEAEQATTSTVQVTSHETTADVVWPSVENAASYELVIKDKNGNAVCTLIFNVNGQLTEIAFSAPSRDNAPQQPQAAGFAFTITGLNSGTGYDLIITSKDKDGETLDEQTLSFTTQGDAPQSLDQVTNDQSSITNKVIRNGNVYILTDDSHAYTVDGRLVR